MRAIVPIAEMTRRIPEAGRIRIGKKQGNRPTAIGEFRFTSHDATALEQIAAMYGGTVRPWSDPKAAEGQSEVITTATEIRVVLPPDPLGGTPIYEMWGGGGCERRCDGVTATVQQTGPDGPEPTDVPCICDQRQQFACKPTTRLCVILPEVRFAGVWRLDTKSWNAAQELPGMVDAITAAMTNKAMPYATLAIKHRRTVTNGKTSKFLVPVLGIGASIEELVAGSANLTSLPSAPADAPAIAAVSAPAAPVAPAPKASPPPPPPPPPPPAATEDPDEDIVDAEVVDEEPPATLLEAAKAAGFTQAQVLRRARGIAEEQGATLPSGLDEVTGDLLAAVVADLGLTMPTGEPGEDRWGKRNRKAQAMATEAWPGSDAAERAKRRKGLVKLASGGRTESSRDLTDDEWTEFFDSLELIVGGSMVLHMRSNGGYELRRAPGGAS